MAAEGGGEQEWVITLSTAVSRAALLLSNVAQNDLFAVMPSVLGASLYTF